MATSTRNPIITATSNNKGDDSSTSTTATTGSSMLKHGIFGMVLLQALFRICLEAYAIRMYAVNEFGRIIHEFDPYFNYRATEVSCCSSCIAVAASKKPCAIV